MPAFVLCLLADSCAQEAHCDAHVSGKSRAVDKLDSKAPFQTLMNQV